MSAGGTARIPILDCGIEVAPLVRVLGALDMVVLEPSSDGNFLLRSEPCTWFRALWRSSATRVEMTHLKTQSAYLENFLIDAVEFWASGRAGRIYSGSWIEIDEAGRSWPLEAQAVAQDGDAFLVIEHLADKYDEQLALLQAARDHRLNEQVLEREVRRQTAAIRQREGEIAVRLLSVTGVRDGETGSHVRRIGLYAAAVGEALGWDICRTEDMKIAAPMHDIGKIGIPDVILQKPGRLTEDEYRIMQQHTVIGAQMLGGSDIPLLNMGREIALCHHEKWNGSGYPSGLKGADIPITARIVAIVDVYDAMVSRRVYKDPIPEAEVLQAMALAAGHDFDPALFELFIGILPKIHQIRDEIKD